ncbi:phage late control D family protein [Halomicronema sp. CCY15110]|uniref:phage late control D family protein n=1 Tax=Halomicronema sp. CCY15110 TaxID=2767773 RepID=UPI001952682E|nr:contractile injection system protein, VgrG/Pvc8 family [Halomicronema sp. CCY15110]
MGLSVEIAVNGTVDGDLAQASRIEVTESMGGTTTYRLVYSVDIAGGDLPLLADDRLGPGSELTISVPVNNRSECLVKGPVHAQHIHLRHGGEGSELEVLGADTSIAMDRETKSAVWAEVSDSDVVQSILGSYGYSPDVQATAATHTEAKHTLVQRDSDLRFVRRLARRNGYLFWLTCDSRGVETAHFKRPSLDGSPAAELTINRDSPTLQTLDLSWDVERPTSVVGQQLDLNSKENLDGAVAESPLAALGQQSLAQIAGGPRSVHLQAPADDAGDLQARGEGALIEAGWFVRASTQTSLRALGQVVRSHTLINLTGAGSRHSGTYWVASVHHQIDAVAHYMTVELLRNGWNSSSGSPLGSLI